MRTTFSVSIFARDEHGRVLLVLHKRLQRWLPAGGEIEAGETPLQAAERELFEETGLVGKFTPLVGVGALAHVDGTPPGLLAYEEHDAGSKGTHLNFCFVADVIGDVATNDEIVDYRFVEDTQGLDCPQNVRELVALVRQSRVNGARVALAPSSTTSATSTTSTTSDLVAVARTWLARFNARDLEGLLALYADDAVHVSPKLRDRQPETKGEIRGKPALRAWWADAMQRLPGLRYEEQHLTGAATGSGGRVFMEYLRRVPSEADLVVAEVLVIDGGVIRESRVFHG